MSELESIHFALDRAGQRRRLAYGLRGLWQGLLIGALLSLALLGIYHVYPLPLWSLGLAGLIPLPCMAVGFVVGAWRKPSRQEVARWVDDRQRLKERLSTAVEVAHDPASGSWRDLVIADAAAHAREVDPRRLLPFRLPRVTRYALVVLALCAGLGFVPEYRSKSLLQRKADEQNIKEVGRQLAELTRRNLEKRPPALEPTEKALEAVMEVGSELSRQKLTRSEALQDLASVSERLKDQLKDMAKDPMLKRMEQAARSGSGKDAPNAASIQKQMDAIQKQIGNPKGNPDSMDQMKRELDKLQEAAQAMADQNTPGTDAEKQKMADSLSALAKQAQDLGLQIPELDEAIEALAANNAELFLKNLDAASKDLEKLRDMAKTLQQLQQQAEKLGKDLGEQLKNGQPEAARQTLDKMAEQLRAANLTPEQLQKMLEEVSQAVDPAGNYGEVAKHLKEAAQQMKSGDKQAGSKSLAAASEELKKLMDQLADAQDLQAAMDALEQASMCIGTGQGWRAGPPRFGEGGKPGSGVGTWSDSQNEWDGQWTAGWDNTDVLRPDVDPRGITDRGPGEVSEGMTPTKVRGQISPGAQMPSITLKGVSIRGQSQVGYEEAATAAQSEAQSALSQEKVPRAYRGAVRDYFDDLKK